MPIFETPKFIQCCLIWLHKQPSAIDVLDMAFWSENGNINVFYNSDNPMPVALKNAFKSFDAGYNDGANEKTKQKNS